MAPTRWSMRWRRRHRRRRTELVVGDDGGEAPYEGFLCLELKPLTANANIPSHPPQINLSIWGGRGDLSERTEEENLFSTRRQALTNRQHVV
uniref:Uncharacterized protein n=1 Tax=Oryza nivara TaxID=4536 RepID=A0A0E0IP75_ORYNI